MYGINEKKYSQTNNTPCMRNPLQSLLGIGETPFCQSILDRTFTPPPSTPQYTTEFFNELQQVDNINTPAPNINISSKIFSLGWKKMKEFTSTGPSGLHFGHMKACSTD